MESAWCAAIHYSTAWSICNHPTLSLSLSFSLSPTLSLCFCLFLSATPAEIEFIGIGYWYYCFNDKWCDALRNTTLLILSTQPLPYPFVCWSMISQFCALRLRAAFFINDLLCFANNVNVRYIFNEILQNNPFDCFMFNMNINKISKLFYRWIAW